mmetsp:Transcript_15994/g.44237  ORF Transcript_15994/g.44237 Transcript_15994/m.44237 type:complete len:350 (+) Transcript_15994:268-1317(+)
MLHSVFARLVDADAPGIPSSRCNGDESNAQNQHSFSEFYFSLYTQGCNALFDCIPVVAARMLVEFSMRPGISVVSRAFHRAACWPHCSRGKRKDSRSVGKNDNGMHVGFVCGRHGEFHVHGTNSGSSRGFARVSGHRGSLHDGNLLYVPVLQSGLGVAGIEILQCLCKGWEGTGRIHRERHHATRSVETQRNRSRSSGNNNIVVFGSIRSEFRIITGVYSVVDCGIFYCPSGQSRTGHGGQCRPGNRLCFDCCRSTSAQFIGSIQGFLGSVFRGCFGMERLFLLVLFRFDRGCRQSIVCSGNGPCLSPVFDYCALDSCDRDRSWVSSLEETDVDTSWQQQERRTAFAGS